MNKKEGLKRVWVVLSVIWMICWVVVIKEQGALLVMVGGLVVWWGLFYAVEWIISGFRGDEKKGETDE